MPTKATSCKPAKVIPCGRKIKGETDDSSKDQSARCVRDTCIFCDETFPDPPEESNPAIPYDECKRVMHVMCIPSVHKALSAMCLTGTMTTTMKRWISPVQSASSWMMMIVTYRSHCKRNRLLHNNYVGCDHFHQKSQQPKLVDY